MILNRISLVLFGFNLVLGSCCNEDFVTPDYDFIPGAIDVTALVEASACSSMEAYTTEGSTPDGEESSCGGPNNNRWFKFRATATGEILMAVQVGSGWGTQQETIVILWDTDATTQLHCESYNIPDSPVYLNYTQLIPGEVYYISVDCTSDTQGTFGLCFITGDYDFLEYAIDVTSMVTPSLTCSPNEAYTTVGATSDRNSGTCWWASPAPRHNRWFKFTASATGAIFIFVNVGGTSGTQRRTYAALWDTNEVTQLSCSFYDNEDQGVFLSSLSLVQGQVYYISVDVADAAGQGTFSLCLSDSA